MAKKYNLFTAQSTTGFAREALYNALDTIATLQIDDTLEQRMDGADKRTHGFYIATQNVALEMSMRGLKVDDPERQAAIMRLDKEAAATRLRLIHHPEVTKVWDKLEKVTGACRKATRKDGKHKWEKDVPDGPERKCVDCGRSRMKIRPFKASSDDDTKHLFYDLWKLPIQRNKEHKVTTDKEARDTLLRKLGKRQEQYRSVIEDIAKLADLDKQASSLKFRMTPDGRFMSGFTVGVTKTHRWSSSADNFGFGSNAQNITEQHRHIFIADDGYELCYADLKQAESNVIAHTAGDENYIEAHLTGDTHTFVTRLVWPEGVCGKEWTWDIVEDKKLATGCAPDWDNRPGHDWRFQSKSVQHGSNLGRTAYGIARKQHVPQEKAMESQLRYFRAFPGIRRYQSDVREKAHNQEPIITPLGIKFKLMGRPWDDSTVREGLAKIPQSLVGHIIGIGCYRIMKGLPEVQLLAQIHDAILFQFPKGRYDLVYKALQLMTIPVVIDGLDGKTRTMVIGTEAAVGHNWGHHVSKEKAEKKGVRANVNGIREITFKSATEWSIE